MSSDGILYRNRVLLGLFIIALVVSINVVPALNTTAVELNNSNFNESNIILNDSNSTFNSTNVSNTSMINPGVISVSLPVEWTDFDIPESITDYMDCKVGFIDKPVYSNPKWNPPSIYKGWKFWLTIRDALKYAAYVIWYGLQVVAAGIVFFAQMVAWFFTTIAWVFYAIGCMIAYAPHLGDTFKLFGFGFDLKHHKSDYTKSRVVSLTVNNSTNSSIPVLSNFTNGSLNDTLNDTLSNVSVSFNTTSVVNSTNVTKLLIDNHYTSGSTGPYENATDNELKAKLAEYQQQNKSVSGSISFINTMFEGLNNILGIAFVIKDVIVAISASLSVPTEGGSIPAGVGTEVAAETGKATVTQVLGNALANILKGVLVEAVSTSVIGVATQQDYNNVYAGQAETKQGARCVIDAVRISNGIKDIGKATTAAGSIGAGFKLGFGILRDCVGVACGVSSMLSVMTFDGYSEPVQRELDFRSVNRINIK